MLPPSCCDKLCESKCLPSGKRPRLYECLKLELYALLGLFPETECRLTVVHTLLTARLRGRLP